MPTLFKHLDPDNSPEAQDRTNEHAGVGCTVSLFLFACIVISLITSIVGAVNILMWLDNQFQ